MIIVHKNIYGDTRSADKVPTLEEFRESNEMHRNDVKACMKFFAYNAHKAGRDHDHTKVSGEAEMYDEFVRAMNGEHDFATGPWRTMHLETERHHLFSRVPEDVNLIDVLEMIADCVCAGISRGNGEVRRIELDPEVLQRAVDNTVEMLKKEIDYVQ